MAVAYVDVKKTFKLLFTIVRSLVEAKATCGHIFGFQQSGPFRELLLRVLFK